MSLTTDMFQREERHDYWLWHVNKYCAIQSNGIFNEIL